MSGSGRKLTQLTFDELCGNFNPVVRSGGSAGHVKENVDLTPGENTTTHTRGGRITFSDRNKTDHHSAKVKALGNGYLGTMSLGPVSQTANSLAWSFVLPDRAIDHLQAGQTLVQTYCVTISDGRGGQCTQNIVIKIVGTNDAPVITSPAPAVTVTEVADGAPGENAVTHMSTGAVKFHDVDTLDTHTAKVVPHGGGYLGTLLLDPVDQAQDTVGWTFKVPDSTLDSLQAGQTLVQKYDVTIDDGHGGLATQIITITIIGANDLPVITSEVGPFELSENPAGGEVVLPDTHQADGAVTFTDVDTLDTHTASAAPGGDGYLGSFILGPVDQDTKSVGWSFSVPDSALDPLKEGERRTQTYTITVDDGHGGTAEQTVTIVLVGKNDGPIANEDSNWVMDGGHDTATGNVLATIAHSVGAPSGAFADAADTDVDSDPLIVTTTGAFDGLYGRLDLASDGAYSYRLYTALENAAAYQTVHALSSLSPALLDLFSYSISDGLASAFSKLSISVFGTDHGVAISGLDIDGGEQSVDEDDLPYGTSPDAGALTQTGTFSLSAPDGIGDLTIGGQAVVSGGVVSLPGPITTSYGLLTITDVNLATGSVSYSYTLAGNTLDHDTGVSNGENSVTESIAVVLTDLDGDNASASLDITVVDDAPLVIVPAHATLGTMTGDTANAALDVDGNIDDNTGADGGTLRFAASLDGADSGLMSNGLSVFYDLSADGHLLTAATSAGNVFTVELNLDGSQALASDTFTVTMLADITGCDDENEIQTETDGSSGSQGGGHGHSHEGQAFELTLPVQLIDGDGDIAGAALGITLLCGEHELQNEQPSEVSLVGLGGSSQDTLGLAA